MNPDRSHIVAVATPCIRVWVVLCYLLCVQMVNAESPRRIVWNAVGQKETVRVGESFDFVYRGANPENTRIVIKPNAAANEYQLELIRYGAAEKAQQGKTAYEIESDSLIKMLRKENAELSLRVKSHKIYVEVDTLLKRTIQRTPSHTPALEQKDPPLSAPEKITQIDNALKSLDQESSNYQHEIRSNIEFMDSLKSRLLRLGVSPQDQSLSKLYSFQIDSLNKRNDYLAQINSVLHKDKELLSKEHTIQELELEKQTKIRNLFVLLSILAIAFAVVSYFNYRKIKRYAALLAEEQARSNKLLLNILPASIAARLKGGNTMIVDTFKEAGVVFIDIAQFTEISLRIDPAIVVAELNKIYTVLDHISEKHGLEKIKTIGDCYMAAAGLPESIDKPAQALVEFALEAMSTLEGYRMLQNVTLHFRCGLECGPVVAGVIGEKKYIYDLWGDTVNTASRMEEYGEPGKIHVSESFKKLLQQEAPILHNQLHFEGRGAIEVKGKGAMQTYFVQRA